MKFLRNQPDYPPQLCQLPNPPEVLTTTGPLASPRAVAIVGSRRATPESLAFARDLACQLAKAGVVVVSGGALGVDAAAHRGALAAGGATWVVCPTGRNRLYPPAHRLLFDEIATAPESRMIWPFEDDQNETTSSFLYRNGVLAALSEALVVVQARFQSGSRNAAAWARDLGRPVWAVTAAPWMADFNGSSADIELGRARPLCSVGQLLKALELDVPKRSRQLALPYQIAIRRRPAGRIPKAPAPPLDTSSWSRDEVLVFSKTYTIPTHLDQIVEATGLPVPPVATALLTLALKDVVVEGPNGFFRRTAT